MNLGCETEKILAQTFNRGEILHKIIVAQLPCEERNTNACLKIY